MGEKILLHVENKYLKKILIKSIADAGIGFLDITDIDDLSIKLDACGMSVVMAIFEINDWNMTPIRVEIERVKAYSGSITLMAVVSKDTSEIVTYAMRAGIRDVLLLPTNRERYGQIVREKMAPYYEKFNPPPKPEKTKEFRNEAKLKDNMTIRESLVLELKHAKRGGYPLSLVMAHMHGQGHDIIGGLVKSVTKLLRDTDRILMIDDETLIGVFPFTPKNHVPIIEEKFREAYAFEYGKMGKHKKLCLYTATYPTDGTRLEALLERLEIGINNSMVINNVRSPLKHLSKSDIENYKQKIMQYKKFF